MGLEDGNDVIVDDGIGSEAGAGGNGQAANETQRLAQERQTIKHQVYAELLSDPDYALLMQIKKQGRNAKIIPLAADGSDPSAKPADLEPAPALDFESASPKDIHDFTLKGVESMLKKMIPDMIKTAQAPLEQQLSQIGGVVKTSAEERLANEIKKVSSKHPDFNNYMDDMVGLQKQNPGLGIEELYFVAKSRKGVPMTQSRETMSERSSNQTAARSQRSQDGNLNTGPTKTGVTNRLDFRSILQKAAVNVINSADEASDGME